MATAGDAYLEWYYNNNVWKDIHYRGVRTLKLPLDMWNYQEIIFAHKLEWVVETGTRHGGSALFFSDLLTGADRTGDVITIDVTHVDLHPDAKKQAGIHFLLGDSSAGNVIDEAMRILPHNRACNVLLILDSDHSRDHLPNPVTDDEHPYRPINRPAIGDLMQMFAFHHGDGDNDGDDRGHH